MFSALLCSRGVSAPGSEATIARPVILVDFGAAAAQPKPHGEAQTGRAAEESRKRLSG